MTNFEYPLFPDRAYRIDIDGEQYYITGKNLIELALEEILGEPNE